MSAEAVAARYAQALYELGVEQGNLPALTDEVRRVSAVYNSSDELRSVLGNPLVEQSARQAILHDVLARLAVGPITQNTVKLLAQRRRLLVLPYLARALERLTDERSGVVRATVTTAAQLPESYFSKLKEQLEASLGKKVLLERELDPTLLGGVVTRIGDRVIDGSLRTRLQRMRQTLLTSR
jgi:F-type H+-transporting ATPase subunit delta